MSNTQSSANVTRKRATEIAAVEVLVRELGNGVDDAMPGEEAAGPATYPIDPSSCWVVFVRDTFCALDTGALVVVVSRQGGKVLRANAA